MNVDEITPESHPLFRYILTRNGHVVALYGGRRRARADRDDRARRFPADDWAVIDRQDEGEISAGSPESVARFLGR